MAPTPAPLTFTRPSRSGGAPHTVSVDPIRLLPTGCTCPAGQHGTVCHAALDVAVTDCYDAALDRYLTACREHGGASLEADQAYRRFRRVVEAADVAAALQRQRAEPRRGVLPAA